jgi:acyl-[acyl-carrier-protein]-phospholipid O-acyltransferase/long-chain-fatty-acid--[acyl-carrier-protein] ligase
MVPHGTVEQALIEAYGLLDAEVPMLAVAGRPDEAKGEALVLLAAMDLDPDDVREKLAAAGFSNLWIPKELRRVEAIPTLATGKLDLRGIQELAKA